MNLMVRTCFKISQGKATLTPSRVARVYFIAPIKTVILAGKEGPKVIRACARNSLHGGNPILFQDGRVFPEQKHGSCSCKLRMT